jgi:hypothetical protein
MAGVLLVGCTAPLPDVTFYGNRTTSVTGPSLWCAVNPAATDVDCAVDRADNGAAKLSLRPGQGVVVSVPAEIADQPWTVVFRYTDGSGVEQDARSAVFLAGERHAYQLDPPAADATFTRVEVQSGLTLVSGTDGGVDIAVLQSWVLLVTAEASPPSADPD